MKQEKPKSCTKTGEKFKICDSLRWLQGCGQLLSNIAGRLALSLGHPAKEAGWEGWICCWQKNSDCHRLREQQKSYQWRLMETLLCSQSVWIRKVRVAQSGLTLCDPHGLYSPWNSPGQNTGVDSLSLLQGIFPTQGSNPGLLHCRQIFYQLSHKGSPCGLEGKE